MNNIEHLKPSFEESPQHDIGYEEASSVLAARRTLWQETRPNLELAHIKIDSPFPLTLVNFSDIHYGSIYSDIEKFDRDVKIVEETPGMYAAIYSNVIDNAMPAQFPDSMLANGLTPNDQARAMNDKFKRLDEKGKILFAIKSPCHEGWTWKKAGIDVNDLIYEDCSFPRLDNGGRVELELPGYTYKIAGFHQFGRFGSLFNKSHPAMQLERVTLAGWADIIAVAHSHIGEAMQTYYGVGANRRDIVVLRTGSYKGNVSGRLNDTPDMWIKDQSGSDGEPGGEAVMLWPNERKMQVFLKPETAYETHNALYYMARIQAAGIIGEVNKLLEEKEPELTAQIWPEEPPDTGEFDTP